MSLFTKSVLIWLIASIVLTGIARLISVYFMSKKKNKLDYSKIGNVLKRDQMIKINFIKNYKYLQ